MLERTTVLQYADNIILFLRRLENLEVRFHRCLVIYFLISGLWISIHKSSLIGVGMDSGEVQCIASSRGCQIGCLPMRYLRLQYEVDTEKSSLGIGC